MDIQDRECQVSQDILDRECQVMEDMIRGGALVVHLTEEVTPDSTQPTHNRTFHRVTQASQVCLVLAILRHQATPVIIDNHSLHLKEVTKPIMACQVQVHSMQECHQMQEYHSQGSLLDLQDLKNSLVPQANRNECLKGQVNQMLREAHTYQCLPVVLECQTLVQECPACHQEDQECLQEDLECLQEDQDDQECQEALEWPLEDQECLLMAQHLINQEKECHHQDQREYQTWNNPFL